ncbi:Integrator complex subunit 14 [Mytilus edulis]|uniref:Integrator complex subunit 14 n=1 Tax=Mytilus edulis TaxID=6550 RepID=A0A8S3T4D2_MYTED|nr:Integrator complex subunit 14 [Mytilus edulis]
MPTVIALDVSLSMCRPVQIPDCTEEYQRRNLAIHGINTLLDHFSSSCRLEFVSMVVFSYLWEQLVPFTRDFESIKTALSKSETYNTTCIEGAITGIRQLLYDEWNASTASQVILVTDGSIGVGQKSLKNSLQNWDQRDPKVPEDQFPLPFPFPCKLHIAIVGNPNDADIKSSMPYFEKLIEINGQGGEIFTPDNILNLKSVQTMFEELGEKYYSPYHGALHCGNFKCPIQLFPAPEPYDKTDEFEHISVDISKTLEILGFLDIADVASPPMLSRHLVLPMSTKNIKKMEESKQENGEVEKENENEEEPASTEDGKVPSFTVLLHGSLKVEGMVALTQVGENWFGILYSWADSKKKSNLMLSLFTPGDEPVNWIGSLDNLAPISAFTEPPYGEDDNKTPFPVRPNDKRSYAQSCVVWIKQSGLQTDLQKVLRHARKLPDKQQQFYKELNRLRRAALSFGFHDLLDAMGTMLDRECQMLPGSAHPDASMQLAHAANALRSDKATDFTQSIMPLRTNFSQEDG